MYFPSRTVNILSVYISVVNFLNKKKKTLAYLEMPQIQQVFYGFRTPSQIHSHLQHTYS